MKLFKIFTFLFLSTYTSYTFAQVGINTNEPHEDSSLHVVTPTNKAVLLPSVNGIENAVDPTNDLDFQGAVLYDNKTNTIYEHDGDNWSSVYDHVVNLKKEFLAHFTRKHYELSCFVPVGKLDCTAEGVLPWTDQGEQDFVGKHINVSLKDENHIQINETGLYRITYRTYGRRAGEATHYMSTFLEKSTDGGNQWLVLNHYKFDREDQFIYTNIYYQPVFIGSVVMHFDANDLLRVRATMGSQKGWLGNVNKTHIAQFIDIDVHGIGEFLLEKVNY